MPTIQHDPADHGPTTGPVLRSDDTVFHLVLVREGEDRPRHWAATFKVRVIYRSENRADCLRFIESYSIEPCDEFDQRVRDEIERVDKVGFDLADAILCLYQTGMAPSVPPIFGAMTRLDLHDEENLRRAYNLILRDRADSSL